MDNLDAFSNEAALLGFDYSDPRSQTYPPYLQQGWPLNSLDVLESDNMSHQQEQQSQQQSQGYTHTSSGQPPQQQQQQRRPNSATTPALQTTGLDLEYASMLPNGWQFQLQQAALQQQQYNLQQAALRMTNHIYNAPSFGGQLQASPTDFSNTATTAGMPHGLAMSTAMDPAGFMTSMAGPMESMNTLAYPLPEYDSDMMIFPNAFNQPMQHHSSDSSIPGSSPTGTALEVQSLPDSDIAGWSNINFVTNSSRQSFDSYPGTVSNPSQNLHLRTNSDSSSDGPHSANEFGSSYEDLSHWPLHSPHDEVNGYDFQGQQFAAQNGLPASHHDNAKCHHSPSSSLAVSPSAGGAPLSIISTGSSETSPISSGPLSPPVRRRKSPVGTTGKIGKSAVKKLPVSQVRKDDVAKKVGRRKGPLRPDQRQQAHEIRKLRACLRCKFLKKTCDKGDPCGGCRPSHARLWQVPCTRIDIKDIGYFMKDWKADYERHVSLGFSVGNIKGFSSMERTLYITHGYGFYLPINAREVFVRDEKCFGVDWVESIHNTPREFEFNTARLSAGMEGVSTTLLSEYLDHHLDSGFDNFVDELFEGTKFLTEILKTAHRFYCKEKTSVVRKALKLVLAYNLTQHVTMVQPQCAEDQMAGKIEDKGSRWYGQILAPVMINFQVKCALADMWRELQKDILEELSSLYSSVYSGEKLKNWPTIFMLAAILLAIWEEMQFDCHYRIPDEKVVNKFCDDMESTPVGVIVGLFQAISTKLPGLNEWDTRKHHHLLGSNPAVCEALTEVRGHISKHGTHCSLPFPLRPCC